MLDAASEKRVQAKNWEWDALSLPFPDSALFLLIDTCNLFLAVALLPVGWSWWANDLEMVKVAAV